MKLTAFVVAEHAEAVNGKLYVMGGCWNTLSAPQLPFPYPHMALAAAVEVPWQSTNEKHRIQVELLDTDGNQAMPQKIDGEFEVGRPPGMRPGDDSIVVLAFNFNNLTFTKAGWYSFVLSIDGTDLGHARFKVQLVQAPTPAAG